MGLSLRTEYSAGKSARVSRLKEINIMTAGDSTFEGLAVPLYGESEIEQQDTDYDILTLTSATGNTADFFVLRDVDHSEILRIEDNGRIWQSISAAAGDNMAIYHTCTETPTGGGQNYAATFLLDEATYEAGNGRFACLNLRYNHSGVGAAASARSFINFADDSTDCTTLFTIARDDVDGGGFVETTTSTATHGLVIYIGLNKYWILCTDSS